MNKHPEFRQMLQDAGFEPRERTARAGGHFIGYDVPGLTNFQIADENPPRVLFGRELSFRKAIALPELIKHLPDIFKVRAALPPESTIESAMTVSKEDENFELVWATPHGKLVHKPLQRKIHGSINVGVGPTHNVTMTQSVDRMDSLLSFLRGTEPAEVMWRQSYEQWASRIPSVSGFNAILFGVDRNPNPGDVFELYASSSEIMSVRMTEAGDLIFREVLGKPMGQLRPLMAWMDSAEGRTVLAEYPTFAGAQKKVADALAGLTDPNVEHEQAMAVEVDLI